MVVRTQRLGWGLSIIAGLALPLLQPASADNGQQVQTTAPFTLLDNVERDWVNLNPPPVRPMAITADQYDMYALNTHASRVLHFDFRNPSSQPTQVFHTPRSPVAIGLWTAPGSGQGLERLVVACRDTWALVILDRATGETVGLLELRDPSNGRILAEPGDLLIDQTTNTAFVSCSSADAVAEVDLSTLTVVRVFHLAAKHPLFLCFDQSKDVLVAPMLSGNNSGARKGSTFAQDGPGVVDIPKQSLSGVLPDDDLFRIVRAGGVVQSVTTNVGTTLFACGVNPATNALWQLNTEANNKDPNKQTVASIQGTFVQNRLSISPYVVAGQARTTPSKIVDLDLAATGSFNSAHTVGQPFGLSFTSTGYAFVTGLLTSNVMLLDSAGNYVDQFNLSAGAIPRATLYSPTYNLVFVYCWGTNKIEAHSVVFGFPTFITLDLGLDPTPTLVKQGRAVFYDASHSMHNNLSCASCHIDGRTDMVVWNLSKPDDDKGPLVTQTLDGINRTVPFHWRGEQQNGLIDFNPAFVDLLGAPAQLSSAEFAKFEAFVLSLEAPPNPFESENRELDNTLQRKALFANSVAGRATVGQSLFISNTISADHSCERCHNFPTGTNNDVVACSVLDPLPRRKFLKVAPFLELWRKEQDTNPAGAGIGYVNVTLPPLIPGDPNQVIQYPLIGASVLHPGTAVGVEHFITNFSFPAQDQADVTQFVHQWDQGIAPATYRATLLTLATANTSVPVLNYFNQQAVWRNCDLVLYGKFTDSLGVMRDMRWTFDRTIPPTGAFRAEDTAQPNQPVSFFITQVLAGQARLVALGVPVGVGEGFGVDFDRDGLFNVQDTVPPAPPLVALSPDNPDSDGDGFPDGYEVLNSGDPRNPAITPSVSPTPTIVRAETKFITTRTARLNVETSEPCTITVSYSTGGANKAKSTSIFAKTHTILLDDLAFSIPMNSPPTPDTYMPVNGTIAAANIVGNVSTSVALPDMPSFNQSLGGPTPVPVPRIWTRLSTDDPRTIVVTALPFTAVSKNTTTGVLNATAQFRLDQRLTGSTPTDTNLVVVSRVFVDGQLWNNFLPGATSFMVSSFTITPPGTPPPPATTFPLPGSFLVSATGATNATLLVPFTVQGIPTTGTHTVSINVEAIGVQATAPPNLALLEVNHWTMPSTTAANRAPSIPFP